MGTLLMVIILMDIGGYVIGGYFTNDYLWLLY
jgi:hypothetical protein